MSDDEQNQNEVENSIEAENNVEINVIRADEDSDTNDDE